MNIFRLIGDLLHLFSIFILILKMFTNKNARGVSLKTQALYLCVFCCRYLDLFFSFVSLYNTLMKIFFISSSAVIVYVMLAKPPYSDTYDKKYDIFFVPYLVVPCFILALLINDDFTLTEVLWSFSEYLESVAIIPQLIVVHQYAKESGGFVENLSSHYLAALGGYRTMYILNWVYRIATEPGYRDWISWICGVIQTAIYCDFLYYYFIAQSTGKAMSLPI